MNSRSREDIDRRGCWVMTSFSNWYPLTLHCRSDLSTSYRAGCEKFLLRRLLKYGGWTFIPQRSVFSASGQLYQRVLSTGALVTAETQSACSFENTSSSTPLSPRADCCRRRDWHRYYMGRDQWTSRKGHDLQELTVSSSNPPLIQRWVRSSILCIFLEHISSKGRDEANVLGQPCQKLVQIVFAIHTDMLEDSTAECLKSHQQTWFVHCPDQYHVLAPTYCIGKSGNETAAYLIKIGAVPRVLDLSISRVESSELWRQRENGILLQLAQKSPVWKIKLDFSDALEHADVGKFILRTIVRNEILVLEAVELVNLSANVLLALVPLFSLPEGYSGLKELHARLSWSGVNIVAGTTVVQYPLFASIVSHQKALRVLISHT